MLYVPALSRRASHRGAPWLVVCLTTLLVGCAPRSELERPDAAVWRLQADQPTARPLPSAQPAAQPAAPLQPVPSVARAPQREQSPPLEHAPSLVQAPSLEHAPSLEQAPPPPAEPLRPPRLRISEVMADPLLVDDRAGEYVELVHLGDRPVAIDALALKPPSGKTLPLERAVEPVLRPGEVLLVTPLGLDEREAMARGLRLPNRAARIELLWHDKVIDVAQWTGKWPWPKHRVGASIERVRGDADGTVGRSWRRARTPLRRVERGSPGVCPWPRPRGHASVGVQAPPPEAARVSPVAETTATGRPPAGEDPVASVAGEGLEPST